MAIDETTPSDRLRYCAMPEGVNAIRLEFDEEEPEAVVFNPAAAPGALVSWAWTQLATLHALLMDESGVSRGYDDLDVAEAVRAVIGPVMNALQFSEERAHELCKAADPKQRV
jgi:hypothetical protein